MNRDEAKNILLLYRSDADAADPQVATAISFMKSDAELREWFEAHCATQKILREKFRQVAAPEGLVQQIVSEHKAMTEKNSRRDKFIVAGALVAIVAVVAVMAVVYLTPHRSPQVAYNTLVNFQSRMLSEASIGYAMTLATNDQDQIKSYLAKNDCPADYTLPTALAKTPATGCTKEDFLGTRVSMICFATGKPLTANHPGDLWLFVIPNSVLKDPPTSATPQLAEVRGISVATWTQGGEAYVLATPGDQQTVQKYL
ncbi:MAG TPA: hypothetical protein VGN23_13230 [Verrucomicrobiae bacterium]|jgi:hypothetical protein